MGAVVSLSFPSKVQGCTNQSRKTRQRQARGGKVGLLYVMQRTPVGIAGVVLSELQLITLEMMNNQIAAWSV
jgi:hypothetical protein